MLKAPSRGVPDGTTLAKAAPGRGSERISFAKVGLRSRYYSDRGEDALTMTTKHLTSAAFQSGFQRLKAELRQKLVERFTLEPQGV